MASLDDLQKDAEEIRQFISTSQRPRVKEVLQRELLTVEQEISLQIHQNATHPEGKEEEAKQPAAEAKVTKVPLYTKSISSYGWDQSDKFVKIYITLPGVESLPKEKITSKFTKNSVEVVAHELDGKNHQLKIMKLCHNIVVGESYTKVKTGNLVVMMKKEKIKQTWEDVVVKAKDTSPLKSGADDPDKDPQKAIMDMMKKMYDEGDDDMKKTINKAWSESMNKVGTGEGLNMSGL
ncbi:calcyclin-binding protein [Exaiptasia diaphana]|uniref:Calcyclin-binding protein n=1 Tax=Exaiptasia diaphana TaxID=2652724 RepID=A0A913WWL7_EXADI|nr:calcyclin-binding protein [Exaiptasia diaphana]KXJ17331.1 Calcyclin-binding protein [Exaiptasia diaphana]